jgi:Yip1 domain
MIGVLTSPRSTYAAVASHPRWFGVLAAVIVLGGAAGSAFVSSEVGQRAVIDAQITSMESMGRHPSEAQLDRIEQMARYYPVFVPVIQAVSVTALTILVAAIGFAVFGALLGGNASFRQVFAMVAHSSVVLLAQGLFSLPLDYARETMVSPTSLAVFAPFLDDGTFAARLLASIDLFYIWWSINLAIGFGVLYKRRTAPVAATMLGIYAAIAVLVAAIRSAMAGA